MRLRIFRIVCGGSCAWLDLMARDEEGAGIMGRNGAIQVG